MKKKMLYPLVVMVAAMVFAASAWAEQATRDECVAKVKEAAVLVEKDGLDKALAIINDSNGPFVWKDTYVFAMDLDSKNVIAHAIKPQLIGKNLMALKDVNGKLFFAEFVNTAKNDGEGWVSYMWPRPGEKKPSPKETYVYRIPGSSIILLAGAYGE